MQWLARKCLIRPERKVYAGMQIFNSYELKTKHVDQECFKCSVLGASLQACPPKLRCGFVE